MQPYGALDCFGWRSEGGAGGNEGKTQGGLPLGNPVCLWQTELFKLNLKSSPSSSGYNRRRRLAPRSSGKQQAERTSVRAAPIVCPEESPLLAASHDNSVIRETITGGMTRRLRRELGLVILWASRRLSVPEGFQRGTKGSGYPVDTTAEGGWRPGVQANNKRSARQCEPRRLFAPRKALWCARRRISPAAGG